MVAETRGPAHSGPIPGDWFSGALDGFEWNGPYDSLQRESFMSQTRQLFQESMLCSITELISFISLTHTSPPSPHRFPYQSA